MLGLPNSRLRYYLLAVRAETSPQLGAETSPQRGAETSLQRGAETSPQRGAETSPQRGAETSPQRGAETSPQRGAENILTVTADVSLSNVSSFVLLFSAYILVVIY